MFTSVPSCRLIPSPQLCCKMASSMRPTQGQCRQWAMQVWSRIRTDGTDDSTICACLCMKPKTCCCARFHGVTSQFDPCRGCILWPIHFGAALFSWWPEVRQLPAGTHNLYTCVCAVGTSVLLLYGLQVPLCFLLCCRYGVYVPLFVPLSVPIVMSLVRAFKWIKSRKQQRTD